MKVSGQENWMDKLFYKKLSDFEMNPESHIWDGIVKRLDEEQEKTLILGHWWTVLLSLLLIIVTGIGAYLLYNKSEHSKIDKKQNRDLPYLNEKSNEDNSAYINYSKNNTVLFTSSESLINSDKSKELSKRGSDLNRSNKNKIVIPASLEYNHEEVLSLNSVSTETDEFLSLSDIPPSIEANDLIVSSDNNFYSSNTSEAKGLALSNLPLKESFLKFNKNQVSAPIFIDGCNVYKDNKTHFFIDFYYAPEIANRSLSTDDPTLQSYVDERTNSEKPIISYSTGVKASIVFGNGLSVRGGLSYSRNSERFDFVKETQTIKKEIFDNKGQLLRTEYTELIIMDKIYNRYSYVDVPILLGYEKDLKDFKLSINGGIGLNLSASQTGKIYKDEKNKMSFFLLENNGEANEPIFRKNAGLSLIGSVGLNYKYNERVMLLLEPSARYYVRSLSDPTNAVNQDYLFLGLNIGLRYRIK